MESAFCAGAGRRLVPGCSRLRPAQVENPNLHVLDAGLAGIGANEAGPRAGSSGNVLARIRNARMAYVNARRTRPLRQQSVGRYASANAQPAACPGPRAGRRLPRHRPTTDRRPRRCAPRLRTDPPAAGFHDTPEPCRNLVARSTPRCPGQADLATRTFEETENAASDDAYGGVAAANLALQRLLEQIVSFAVAEAGTR